MPTTVAFRNDFDARTGRWASLVGADAAPALRGNARGLLLAAAAVAATLVFGALAQASAIDPAFLVLLAP